MIYLKVFEDLEWTSVSHPAVSVRYWGTKRDDGMGAFAFAQAVLGRYSHYGMDLFMVPSIMKNKRSWLHRSTRITVVGPGPGLCTVAINRCPTLSLWKLMKLIGILSMY